MIMNNSKNDLQQQIDLYNYLMLVPDNILLKDKITFFISNGQTDIIENVENNVIAEQKEFVRPIIILEILNEVFSIAVEVHMNFKQPDKVIQYIIYRLKKFAQPLQDLFKELLISIISNKRRFQIESTQLEFIGNYLKQHNISDLTTEYKPEIGTIKFFTDNDSRQADAFIDAVLSVRALLPTKLELHEKYIKDNFSPELLKALSNSGFQLSNGNQIKDLIFNFGDTFNIEGNFDNSGQFGGRANSNQ